MKKQSRVRSNWSDRKFRIVREVPKEVSWEGTARRPWGPTRIRWAEWEEAWCAHKTVVRPARQAGIVISSRGTPSPPGRCVHSPPVLPCDREAETEQVTEESLGCWENVSLGAASPEWGARDAALEEAILNPKVRQGGWRVGVGGGGENLCRSGS